jgi:hypothetical protein
VSKLQRITKHDTGELYGYEFVCPGCEAFVKARNLPPEVESARLIATHVIPTTGPNAWGFNGDVDRPTFTPSVLVYETQHTDGAIHSPRCHSFVRDGRIEFLSDCGHPLAGQTVELPEIAETS